MSNSALLVMDVQQGVMRHSSPEPGYLPTLRRAIDAAHAAAIPVIYVVVGFREGCPEVSARNKSFAAIARHGGFTDTDSAAAIHPDIAPQPGDIIVTKRRVSAFTGSDLDVVLRSADIDTLVLAGIATSGVVLSTVRQAADLDYRLTVLADGCFDTDPEIHRILIEKVFPRQADVITADTWTAQVR